MNLKLEIRRNEDGLFATETWEDFEFHPFWWSEGNGSCDCNRELFFLRARGEDDEDDVECGDERYSIRCSDADTGEVLYDELLGDRP